MIKASIAEAAAKRCGQKVICASCIETQNPPGGGGCQAEGIGLLDIVSLLNSLIC